jgi:zinc protease
VLAAIKVNTDELKPYEDAVCYQFIKKRSKTRNYFKPRKQCKIRNKTLVLSNGAKVTQKIPISKNDEVSFEAVSLGGSNLYSNEEMKSSVCQWCTC